MSGFRVRPAQAADITALAQLGPATFQEAFGHRLPAEATASRMAALYAPERLAQDLADPDQAWWVAVSGATVCGFAVLRSSPAPMALPEGPALELGRLYVDAAWHGRGPGPALLETALARAWELGSHRVWLLAWTENGRASAFYRKMGFQDMGMHVVPFGGTDLPHRVLVREHQP